MIGIFQTVVLGLVQGLGEFLPISSSAHLVLVPGYMHWPDPGLAFDVALHLGTLLAVVLYFWRDLVQLALSLLQPKNPALAKERRLVGLLGLATVPGAVIGFLLEHQAETLFRSPRLIAIALIVLGLFLWLADRYAAGDRTVDEITPGLALLIGLAQGLALIPGVSRSGITITVALFLGFRRTDAARFSFLMSIPIIAGAGVLKFKEILLSPDKAALAAGFVAAAVSGFAAIWFLLRYVQRNRYTPFVIYRWALGAFVLMNLAHFQ